MVKLLNETGYMKQQCKSKNIKFNVRYSETSFSIYSRLLHIFRSIQSNKGNVISMSLFITISNFTSQLNSLFLWLKRECYSLFLSYILYIQYAIFKSKYTKVLYFLFSCSAIITATSLHFICANLFRTM